MVASLLVLAVGCQEYNLAGPAVHESQYNPPELGVERHTDDITQVTVPAVDVLWVIDNSGSMAEEQKNLRDNFDDFMRYFSDSGLDFHVGVVSTDMDNRNESGKLIQDDSRRDRYIDSSYSQQDAISSFRERANLGTMGSSDERGKDAAYTALNNEREKTNVGFYRDDASLSVIVISDEMDHSRQVSVAEFASWINGLKADDDMTWFSAIVGPSPRGCATAEVGTGYLEVVPLVGGIDYSICESDYSSVLEELGLQAAGLKREFYLSLVPVESTIVVSVKTDGDKERFDPDEYTYDPARNSVTFATYIPEPLSVVSISYEVLSSAHDPGDEGEGTTDTAAVE